MHENVCSSFQVKIDESCNLEHVTRSRPKGNRNRRPPTRIHLKEVFFIFIICEWSMYGPCLNLNFAPFFFLITNTHTHTHKAAQQTQRKKVEYPKQQ